MLVSPLLSVTEMRDLSQNHGSLCKIVGRYFNTVRPFEKGVGLFEERFRCFFKKD